MILSLSKALKRLPVFSYIGRYSIIVIPHVLDGAKPLPLLVRLASYPIYSFLYNDHPCYAICHHSHILKDLALFHGAKRFNTFTLTT